MKRLSHACSLKVPVHVKHLRCIVIELHALRYLPYITHPSGTHGRDDIVDFPRSADFVSFIACYSQITLNNYQETWSRETLRHY